MKKTIKKAIEEYQCSGCINGGDISCFEKNDLGGVGCGHHRSGTIIVPIGSVLLGMPKGFNRLGSAKDLKPNIFEKFEDGWGYNKYNVPTWKYLTPDGHTMVRGVCPRVNGTFIHIFLENCIDNINCLEITQEDIDYMD